MNQLIYIIRTMRPKQWVKNLFIFTALIFSLKFTDISLVAKCFIAFVLFCLLASSIYILNDIIDINEDKIHPKKAKRPLPSGKLKIQTAYISLVILSFLSIILAFYFLNFKTGLLFLTYFLINISYSLKLKHVVILDVFIIAIGFVLRVLVGALAINVVVSHWLLICTMFIALFLGFCKRRNELNVLENKSKLHRSILSEYSAYFLDQMVSVTTAAIIISYTLYTTAPETINNIKTDKLIITVPFVLYGIFRYLYLTYQKDQGGNPTDLVISDKPFIINFIAWATSILIIVKYT